MSKGKKNSEYKVFPICDIKSGLTLLNSLLVSVITNLDKYKQYRDEIECLIGNNSEIKNGEIVSCTPIPSSVFDDINDKIMYRQMNLLKYLADEQKASFSYKNIRKILLKKGFLAKSLPEKVSEILNDFLDIRNWSFHNPQSHLSASKEVSEKMIPDNLKGLVTVYTQFNPILIYEYESYDVTFLLSLLIHMEKRISQISMVLECMKKDYQEMYEAIEPPSIMITPDGVFPNNSIYFKTIKWTKPREIMDREGLITQVSMAMQKGNYDGTDECFNKWTFNSLNKEKSKS